MSKSTRGKFCNEENSMKYGIISTNDTSSSILNKLVKKCLKKHFFSINLT